MVGVYNGSGPWETSVYLVELKTVILHDPVLPFLYLCSTEMSMCVYQVTWTMTFTVSKPWNHLTACCNRITTICDTFIWKVCVFGHENKYG
jgi:hypothetical protein